MTYTIQVSSGCWRIGPARDGLWELNRETESGWTSVGRYRSAREAALEFGTGKAAHAHLDEAERKGAFFDLDTWAAQE
jgi:hypothetical protein